MTSLRSLLAGFDRMKYLPYMGTFLVDNAGIR